MSCNDYWNYLFTSVCFLLEKQFREKNGSRSRAGAHHLLVCAHPTSLDMILKTVDAGKCNIGEWIFFWYFEVSLGTCRKIPFRHDHDLSRALAAVFSGRSKMKFKEFLRFRLMPIVSYPRNTGKRQLQNRVCATLHPVRIIFG